MPLHRFPWFRPDPAPQYTAVLVAPAPAFAACPAALLQGMNAGHLMAMQQVYALAYERAQQQQRQRRSRRLARLYAVSEN
jgi:hypothetical protein